MMNKFVLFLFSLVSITIIVWYLFFYDDIVTSGSKYGFEIGMTKVAALEALNHNFADNEIQVVLLPDIEKNPSNQVMYVDIQQLDNNSVADKIIWQLRFGKSDKNVLILRFADERLYEMTRYRRAFIP